MVENRVKKLEYEERKAMKTLANTMRTHEIADQVHSRRMDDYNFKM